MASKLMLDMWDILEDETGPNFSELILWTSLSIINAIA